MYETEIHGFIYLSKQMILRHQFFQEYNLIFILSSCFLFPQHAFTAFFFFYLYIRQPLPLFLLVSFGFCKKSHILVGCETLLMV